MKFCFQGIIPNYQAHKWRYYSNDERNYRLLINYGTLKHGDFGVCVCVCALVVCSVRLLDISVAASCYPQLLVFRHSRDGKHTEFLNFNGFINF